MKDLPSNISVNLDSTIAERIASDFLTYKYIELGTLIGFLLLVFLLVAFAIWRASKA